MPYTEGSQMESGRLTAGHCRGYYENIGYYGDVFARMFLREAAHEFSDKLQI